MKRIMYTILINWMKNNFKLKVPYLKRRIPLRMKQRKSLILDKPINIVAEREISLIKLLKKKVIHHKNSPILNLLMIQKISIIWNSEIDKKTDLGEISIPMSLLLLREK